MNAGGGSLGHRCFRTRDFRISHFDVMSPALWFPFRLLTRLSHPGRTAAECVRLKGFLTNHKTRPQNLSLTSATGFSSQKIQSYNTLRYLNKIHEALSPIR